MQKQFVAVNPVTLGSLPDSTFTPNGLVISSPDQLLKSMGVDPVLVAGIELINDGVQGATSGVIQDPAGSAIGTGAKPGGGGASGAIYAAFTDLEPIPAMPERAAIFNGSNGPGKRILHSHSPQLKGSPDDADARHTALQDIANTYANALLAFSEQYAQLGADNQRLNLVPISAGIFANNFRNPDYLPYGHLDPSYTLVAVALAIASVQTSIQHFPKLALYYYDKIVYNAAQKVQSNMTAH